MAVPGGERCVAQREDNTATIGPAHLLLLLEHGLDGREDGRLRRRGVALRTIGVKAREGLAVVSLLLLPLLGRYEDSCRWAFLRASARLATTLVAVADPCQPLELVPV